MADVYQSLVGRPQIMRGGRTVTILCPRRHVVASVRRSDWAGSRWETNIGDPRFTITCDDGSCGPTPRSTP